MPRGFEHIREYDGRASVSSSSSFSAGTSYLPYRWGDRFSFSMSKTPDRGQTSSSTASPESDESSESYKSWLKEHLSLPDVSTDLEGGEIHNINGGSPGTSDTPSVMDFSVLQHLNSLPYQARRREGRDAIRQSSDDTQGRTRSSSPLRFKREDTTNSMLSQESTIIATSEICTCPVGYTCRSRETGDVLDCRTLVLEWQDWQDRMNEEAHDIHAAVPPSDAPLVEENVLQELGVLLERFKNLGPNNRDPLRRTAERVLDWTTRIKSSNLSAEVLENSQVLGSLETFLSDDNIQVRCSRNFPIRLEEDLTVLLRKWKRGDLTCDPNRGLTKVTTLDQNGIPLRSSYRLDPKWEHYVSANFYGEGHLVNGQVFYSRLELMRDGAHSARIAGISGTTKDGARSIIMGYHDIYKKNFYADIDMGETIDYMGTALKANEDTPEETNVPDEAMATAIFDSDKKPTACTQMLMTSFRTGNPVRVIRSPKLARQVKNRPEKCYRYDGLYKVVKMKPLKLQRQIWSFRLQRLPGQGPLRGFSSRDEQPSSHGARPGYKRYNIDRYAGGRQTSSRSTKRSRRDSPLQQ